MDLQRLVRGEGYTECVPPALMKIGRMGGVTIGAFAGGGSLVGFVLGFTGMIDRRLTHWSHRGARCTPRERTGSSSSFHRPRSLLRPPSTRRSSPERRSQIPTSAGAGEDALAGSRDDADVVAVRVPEGIDVSSEAGLREARAWRMCTRAAFQLCLRRGYSVVGFAREGAGFPCFLLAREHSQWRRDR